MNEAWATPGRTWDEILDRYIAFVQEPSWRGRVVKADKSALKDYLEPAEADRLRTKMLRYRDTSMIELVPLGPTGLTDERLRDLARDQGSLMGKSALAHWFRAYIMNHDARAVRKMYGD